MNEKKTINRWKIVPAALLIQLSLGVLYAWSVFTPYLTGIIADRNTKFQFTSTETQIIFSVGLAVFAIVMIFAGKWQRKYGPRLITLIGGIFLGCGYVLASFIGTSFINQMISIGIIGGAGIGLVYVCPIAVGVRWFPDQKGMITGLAVAGFGFGAMIWVKLAGSWANLINDYGVLHTFFIYGIIVGAIIIINSIFMVYPPDGWKPSNWEPPQADENSIDGCSLEFESSEMLHTQQFHRLWIAFIFSCMAGLMVIGIIKLFGIDALQRAGYDINQANLVAGTAMAIFYALGNGLGRIMWGLISEKMHRKHAIALLTFFQAVMMFLFYYMGEYPGLLYLGSAIIGFNFGGNFALFPTITSDYFGTKSIGPNYGWMFTAYGVGGILGPVAAGFIRDTWHDFHAAFNIAGLGCIIASLIALSLTPPRK